MIKAERHNLWRSVDQDGHVVDILRRCLHDRATAATCFRKLIKGFGFQREKGKILAIFLQSLD
jgi:putative transposase